MEYLPGEDVSTILSASRRRREHLPLGAALKIVADAARGLHYAHEMKDEHGAPLHIVHRDISPSNLYVTYEGQVKVLDFGVAKAATQVVHTDAGRVKGKHQYMAPEQARGEEVDRRADVFALGVTLYEALTLVRPFARPNDLAVLKAITEGTHEPIRKLRPDLPAEVEAVVVRAMARTPGERFQTAGELAGALEHFLEGHTSSTSAAGLAALMRDLMGDERIERRTRIRSASAYARKLQTSVGADGSSPLTPSSSGGDPGSSSSGRWEPLVVRPRRSTVLLAVLGAVLAAAAIGTVRVFTVAPPDPPRGADRAMARIRLSVAEGRLRDVAVGELETAYRFFPDDTRLPALRQDVAEALREEGTRELRAGRIGPAIEALELSLHVNPDAVATAQLQAAPAGLVRPRRGHGPGSRRNVDRPVRVPEREERGADDEGGLARSGGALREGREAPVHRGRVGARLRRPGEARLSLRPRTRGGTLPGGRRRARSGALGEEGWVRDG
jgi:hypothetical protein